jgi:hypothetical protein
MPRPIVVRPGQQIDRQPQQAPQVPGLSLSVSSNATTAFADLYNARTHKWNPKYVFPSEYRLRMNMTRLKPTATNPLRWRVESLENRFRPIEIVQTGLVDQLPIFGGGGGVTARIPSAGPVRVTVSGQGLGPDPRVYDINVKDYLVVSIGDSYSSGQGNPDRNGIPAVGSEAICEATTLVMLVQKLHDALEEIPAIGEAVEFFEDIFEGLVDIGEGILGFVRFGGAVRSRDRQRAAAATA